MSNMLRGIERNKLRFGRSSKGMGDAWRAFAGACRNQVREARLRGKPMRFIVRVDAPHGTPRGLEGPVRIVEEKKKRRPARIKSVTP